MKKSLFILLLFVSLGCSESSKSSINETQDWECGTTIVSGVKRTLFTGPRGGCYYINTNGNKSYVDRSECKC